MTVPRRDVRLLRNPPPQEELWQPDCSPKVATAAQVIQSGRFMCESLSEAVPRKAIPRQSCASDREGANDSSESMRPRPRRRWPRRAFSTRSEQSARRERFAASEPDDDQPGDLTPPGRSFGETQVGVEPTSAGLQPAAWPSGSRVVEQDPCRESHPALGLLTRPCVYLPHPMGISTVRTGREPHGFAPLIARSPSRAAD